MTTNRFLESIRLITLNNDSPLIYDAKKLLTEYGDYMYKDLKLTAGKEHFCQELEQFPTSNYLPPLGIFIVAKIGDILVGCVGIKESEQDSCEMKRLFVRSSFRSKGIGQLLCNCIIKYSRKMAYKRILLDTNLEMAEAIALYHKCGFGVTKPYCVNENEHPVFMEYILE